MNLLATIGQYVRDGLTDAETVVKLEVEHAIQVSEDWLRKIKGADGFALVANLPQEAAAVASSAEGEAADLTQSAEAVVEGAVDKVEEVPGEVAAKVDEVVKEIAPGGEPSSSDHGASGV